MLSAVLTLASFMVAILIGVLMKAIYYSIPVVTEKWKLWTLAADADSKAAPDFWLTVLLSLPVSGVAAGAVVLGLESKYDFVPWLWPVVCLFPNYLLGPKEMLHQIKNWKLNLLESIGVAVSATSAIIATRLVLGLQ